MTKNLEEFGGVNTASKRSAATTTDGMMHGSEVNEPAVSPVPGPAVCLELLNTCRSQGKRLQLAVAVVSKLNSAAASKADVYRKLCKQKKIYHIKCWDTCMEY